LATTLEQGAGVKPMEQYMEHEGDSTKPHNHSNSAHEHSNAADTASTQKTISEKTQHDHPPTGHNDANKQDTSKNRITNHQN
jgi:hypothetical protein